MGWPTFEALTRTVSLDKFARTANPILLIEVLATEGAIAPSETDVPRQLANSRIRIGCCGVTNRPNGWQNPLPHEEIHS
jgi:hypothetical protein